MKFHWILAGAALSAFWGPGKGLVQAQETFKWGSVAMGGGGFVSTVIAVPNDPGVFYARTDVGGAYRWQEASQSWLPLIDFVSADERGLLGVDGIAVDPRVKGRVYLIAGTTYWNAGKTNFLRSDDYGATWEKIDVTSQFKVHGNGMGRANGERLAVDPNNSDILYCGSRWTGLWKSVNRGTTWQRMASLDVTGTPNEAGVNIIVFDRNSVKDGITQTLYAGISRPGDNVYQSLDAGKTWALIPGRPTEGNIMPQRFVLTEDGKNLYVTYGSGGGPHPQTWNNLTDYYNRGAVYKWDIAANAWTNISPVNFMDKLDSAATMGLGAFSGLAVDPTNSQRILVSSINSWRGPQFWQINGKWKDSWGDNIFASEDGGKTWRDMFRYYWLDGGVTPSYAMIDSGGIPWIVGSTVHWIGSIAIDPNNPNRAFVTSGNGVFRSDSVWKSATVGSGTSAKLEGRATWKFAAHGIEETVPLDLVSIPGGPLISVIGDYDGFVHQDALAFPKGGRLKMADGLTVGTTTGIAFAAKNKGTLVKVAGDWAKYDWGGAINPVSMSKDTGKTWTPASALPPGTGSYNTGKVAISANGEVIAWSPRITQGEETTDYNGMFRTIGGGNWTASTGIDFPCRPVADPENANKFYAYNNVTGAVFVSLDGAQSFKAAGMAGPSAFRTARAAPGREGDLWIPLTEGGLTRSTNSGESFAKIAAVTRCEAIGFGKEAPGAAYPAAYIFGTVAGVTGVFQSVDAGATWVRVNDDAHQYGGLANGEFVMGDANTFGVVYMSTAGRGIAYRHHANGASIGDSRAGQGLSRNSARFGVSGKRLDLRLGDWREAQLSVFDLNGGLVYQNTFAQSVRLPLDGLLPRSGSYVGVIRGAGPAIQKKLFHFLK